MHNKKLTYKNSGVDTSNTNQLVKFISNLSSKTKVKGSKIAGFKNIGGFGSLFDLKPYKIKDPILVSSTDGVGAKPLFFLDYIAIGKVKNKKYKDILKGISRGCGEAGCYLAGGETAEMPGIYEKDKFDLAGFSVGIVERKKILDGSKIKSGDVVMAVPSSGVHSNGFSLIRHILKLKKINNKKIIKNFLTPTKIYVKEILNLNSKNLLNGCCN